MSKKTKAFIRSNNLKYSDYANPNATCRYPLPTIIDGTYFEICPEYQLPLKGDTDKIKAICKICSRIICGTLSVTTNFKTHLKRLHKDILSEFEKYKEKKLKTNRLSRPPRESSELQFSKQLLQYPVKLENDYTAIQESQIVNNSIARTKRPRSMIINCPNEKYRQRSCNSRNDLKFTKRSTMSQYDGPERKVKEMKITPKLEITAKQKQFDKNLVNYIIMSMKPFSTVDDPNFIKMIKDIDPEINIMSRKSFEQCITEKYNLQIEREQY